MALQLLTPALALAAWHQASSEHFVVYANQSAKQIQRYTEKLERYHAAFGALTNNKEQAPSPSNRVNVYVVRNDWQVRKLYGDNASRYLGGFYRGRAGGSIAIVPRVKGASSGDVSQSERTLLHEYAHHYMFSVNERVIPRWFGEGFAEFYSTATFKRDGSVGLGLPANHRGYELGQSRHVPLEEVFDTRQYLKNKRKNRHDNFYGRSWLLYHYLFFSKERQGQVAEYLGRLEQGEPALAAAAATFGPLETLNKELVRYMHRRKLRYLEVPASLLKIAPVEVRRLNPAEAAVMPVIIRSKRGVSREEAIALLPEAREVAAQFPKDAVVLGALAEAEVDAGNYHKAIAAADAAIALDPNQIQAHIQKGYALTRLAKALDDVAQGDAKDAEKEAAWRAVRLQFVAANRLEVENPLPLVHFYLSYLHQGIEPTKNAIVGLESAFELAPFDKSVRALVARQQLTEERFAEARATLIPLAYGPHQALDNEFLALLKLAESRIAERDGPEDGPEDGHEDGREAEAD